MLKDRGFVGEVIGQTPSKVHPGASTTRGEKIQEWFDEHGVPEQFVMIDDDPQIFHHEGHFVKTHMHQGGLTEERAERAIEVLQGNLIDPDDRRLSLWSQ